jgi:hypothetical protein
LEPSRAAASVRGPRGAQPTPPTPEAHGRRSAARAPSLGAKSPPPQPRRGRSASPSPGRDSASRVSRSPSPPSFEPDLSTAATPASPQQAPLPLLPLQPTFRSRSESPGATVEPRPRSQSPKGAMPGSFDTFFLGHAAQGGRGAEEEKSPSRGGGACTICLDAPADYLVLPCGHQCGCLRCLEAIASGLDPLCPICRAPLSGLVRVFAAGYDGSKKPPRAWSGEAAATPSPLPLQAAAVGAPEATSTAVAMAGATSAWAEAGAYAAAALESSVSADLLGPAGAEAAAANAVLTRCVF